MNKIINIDYISNYIYNDKSYDGIFVYLFNNKIIKVCISNEDDDNNNNIFMIYPNNYNSDNIEYNVEIIQWCNNYDFLDLDDIDNYNFKIIKIITNNERFYIIMFDEEDNKRHVFLEYDYNYNIYYDDDYL